MVGEHGISIWFFIGVSLLVNGALILGAGIWQIVNPPAVHVVLYNLHANVWWGALLLLVGIAYSVRFRPQHKAVDQRGN